MVRTFRMMGACQTTRRGFALSSAHAMLVSVTSECRSPVGRMFEN